MVRVSPRSNRNLKTATERILCWNNSLGNHCLRFGHQGTQITAVTRMSGYIWIWGQNLRAASTWAGPTDTQNVITNQSLKTGNQVPGIFWNQAMHGRAMFTVRSSKGHCFKLWGWSLSHNGDPRVVGMPEPWHVWQGKLQTWGGVCLRKVTCAKGSRVRGVVLPKPTEAQKIPSWSPDAEHRSSGFVVCWVWVLFWSNLFLMFSCSSNLAYDYLVC